MHVIVNSNQIGERNGFYKRFSLEESQYTFLGTRTAYHFLGASSITSSKLVFTLCVGVFKFTWELGVE